MLVINLATTDGSSEETAHKMACQGENDKEDLKSFSGLENT